MYHRAYGIIETFAPLHVGASAGEETGNLNLIFRDQFTQTGIIPGSSIRGRFRADMREKVKGDKTEISSNEKTQEESEKIRPQTEGKWYGHEAILGQENTTTEALVKFEYASLVWLPVFCPGQPIVWVTCRRLLKRYQQITGKPTVIENGETKLAPLPQAGHAKLKRDRKFLFFNLGFLDDLTPNSNLSDWVPNGVELDNLVVVDDTEIGIIHDMALYRQTRTKLENDAKKVEHFFGVEALPEGSILIFPIAIKEVGWYPFTKKTSQDLYFGGLESIGFGRCQVTLVSEKYKLCPGKPTL
jgi:CRISPR-associated protein Cmr4